ncbi:Cytochrome c biogenesis ATP-binding export protein CcmA [Paraburkholderia caffeinitolerans]|uniref:Cytochrome c biogenesis ATP-binding export protein CcmA n=1 Tax=Paraburkholderia caffeinitolerans TaxID=1723730 RepID=A0A6J5FF50_9BURK|nr:MULTISPECIES: heme ABC exporter ATP-binding protein CcmA [Paraburkholderia]CAB3778975.1 Cytochrome c biogenesis ATP-binding export protein CcmA [Paraburkholderia caffeinitolerans]
MYSIEQLAVERGGRTIVSGIDLSIEPGWALQIHGANGSGKTTLLGALAGLLPLAKGRVCWRGDDVRRAPRRFRSELAYVGHANGVSDDLTVLENIRFAALLGTADVSDGDASSASDSVSRENEVLEQAGLYALRHTRLSRLSQGQRRRVALMRLMLGRKPLWLLDEPGDALDASATDWFATCIDTHLRAGGIVALTTHRPLESGAGRTRHLYLERSSGCLK